MKSTHLSPIERGILTSSYKREIRNNIRNMKADSLSRIKESILYQYANSLNSTVEILRVSFILVAIFIIVA
ncbi:hypothetical protein [Polaribacter gangjinensis]|uniref:Uncharacterized protein n=1 Tax=Polaribacter gangjinensis TaxID=574710 RepID=A0A2S7WBS7_9FLAO|nr:hypothetical protein [Polaribacter gangjinensis]PQJ75084.1 hypothetical protein BTO13_07390 [Polaribacter gangjinensis]